MVRRSATSKISAWARSTTSATSWPSRRVAVLDDAGARFDEAAQHGFLGDDLGVVAGVGGRGYRLGERDQVGGTAEALEFAAAVQFGGHRHRVGRFTAAVEVEDRVVETWWAGR